MAAPERQQRRLSRCVMITLPLRSLAFSSFITKLPVAQAQLSLSFARSARKCVTCTASLKPAKVAIAGAGIAGLSIALALLKTPNTGVKSITVLEPRETVDEGQGAALNINGAAAILLRYGVPLWDIANPMKSVVARKPDGAPLFTIKIDQALSTSARAQEMLVIDGRPAFMTVMRDKLQEMLVNEVSDAVEIRRGKSNFVTGVEDSSAGGRFLLADGSKTERYDLLIGADGLRSTVRTYVAGRQTPPVYTRLRVQWAVTAPGSVVLPAGVVEQWFGDGCYVLRYAAGRAPHATEMLAISFRDRRRVAENASYLSDNLREDVGRRLARAGMPEEVMSVFRRAVRFIETGVYQHELLSRWSSNGCCTLAGDAAHAMPPYLGQGANQAVQDAYTLAFAISNIGQKHDGLSEALSWYERTRKAPVEAILQTSRAVGLIETQGGPIGMAIRDNAFRLMGFSGGIARAFIEAATPRVG